MTLRHSCLPLAGLLLLVAPAPAAPAKPNIVVLLADDLGYGDVSCFNAKSKLHTPHVDRLAREGMRFTDAHSGSSVCSPTRYGLLTGRYAWRTRLPRRDKLPACPLVPGAGKAPCPTSAHFLANLGAGAGLSLAERDGIGS